MQDFYNNKDDEFLSFLKRVSGKGDIENNSIKYRFLNENYTVQLSTLKKQDVVIKIINKGGGKYHLSKLIKYIGRELSSQESEEKSILFDQNGDPLNEDELTNKMKQWENDFEKWEQTLSKRQELFLFKKYAKDDFEGVGRAKEKWDGKFKEIEKGYKNSLKNENSKEQTREALAEGFTEEFSNAYLNVEDYSISRNRAGEIWHEAHTNKIDISDSEDYEEFLKMQEERNKAVSLIGDNFENHYKFFNVLGVDIKGFSEDYLFATSDMSRLEARSLKDGVQHERFNVLDIDKEDRGLSKQESKKLENIIYKEEENPLESFKLYLKDNREILGISEDTMNASLHKWSTNYDKKHRKIPEEHKQDAEKFLGMIALLENMKYDKGLNKEEGDLLFNLKKYQSEYKLSKDIERGSVVKNISSGEIGIIKFEGGKGIFKTLSEDGEMKREEVEEKDIVDIRKELKSALKMKPKDFTHMMLSTGGSNPNPDDALKATQSFLEDSLRSKGFDYVFTMHEDTKNLHFHVVINNTSRQNALSTDPRKKNLDLNKFDLQIMREEYTRHLDGWGINRHATIKKDRAGYLHRQQRDLDNNTNFNNDWYRHQISRTDSSTFDALKFRTRAINSLNRIADVYEGKNQKDMRERVLLEKEKYINISPEDIKKTLDNTLNILKSDEKALSETIAEGFLQEIGKPNEYKKQGSIKDKLIKDYQQHLEGIEENLEELPQSHITPKLQKQIDFTRDYISARKEELDTVLKKEEGLEKDITKES